MSKLLGALENQEIWQDDDGCVYFFGDAVINKEFPDSETVPYITVSTLIGELAKGVTPGNKAEVTFKDESADCIVRDISSTGKTGELSAAAAKAAGIEPKSENSCKILYKLWPGVPA